MSHTTTFEFVELSLTHSWPYHGSSNENDANIDSILIDFIAIGIGFFFVGMLT